MLNTFAVLFIEESRLDILICNAAAATPSRQTSEDGFEMMFGVNHLGKNFIFANHVRANLILLAKINMMCVASMA